MFPNPGDAAISPPDLDETSRTDESSPRRFPRSAASGVLRAKPRGPGPTILPWDWREPTQPLSESPAGP